MCHLPLCSCCDRLFFSDVFSLRVCPGGGGEGRHGESEAGQQEDSLQPAPGSRGPALPDVQPQEHGEKSVWKKTFLHPNPPEIQLI